MLANSLCSYSVLRMVSFSSTSFPLPKNWQDFERCCRVLFSCILQDPNTQTNGRSGQRQHGVDVFGNRGGAGGPLVGVQCKGRDGQFGGQITDKELRDEVAKTEKFQPSLSEFILVTTARDDAKIQESARALTTELNSKGRQISVLVMGWDSLESEIARHPEAIREFHPDASPFTDEIISRLDDAAGSQTRVEAGQAEILKHLKILTSSSVAASTSSSDARDALDQYLHKEIDGYRDLLRSGKPRIALRSLEATRERCFQTASNRIRFRLLTNMGAAKLALSLPNEAAQLFLEAFPYDPDDPIARSNQSAAYLLKGDINTARQFATNELARNPNNVAAAIARLQALDLTESIDDVWATFSEAIRNDVRAQEGKVHALRARRLEAWREQALLLARLHPESNSVQRIAAEATLDEILSKGGAVPGLKLEEAWPRERLQNAIELLQSHWGGLLENNDEPVDCALAHNLALGHVLLGIPELGVEVLEQAIKRHGFDEALYQLRAQIAVEMGKREDAINFLSRLPEDPRRDMFLADLVSSNDPQRARQLVTSSFPSLESDRERISALQIAIRAAIALPDRKLAEDEATALSKSYPQHVAGPLALHRVCLAFGQEGAAQHLEEAKRRLHQHTEFLERLQLAAALEASGLDDDAANVLFDHIDISRDSDGLRLLLTSLINADRRASVAKILSGMPTWLREQNYFLRMEAALAQRAGDIIRMETALEKYLRKCPDDLAMRLQLATIKFRKGDDVALREHLDIAESIPGKPVDVLRVALFLDNMGEALRAHRLAYRTLLLNPDNPKVALGYTGIFLRPGHSEDVPIDLDHIDVDSSFELEGPKQEIQHFVIEADGELRPSASYIDPSSDIAQRALRLKVGATLALGSNEEWRVKSIKHKYLDALHNILSSFHVRFPTAGGLQRFIVEGDDDQKLAPILASVRQRHDDIEKAFETYENSDFPLSGLASCLSSTPVETFIGLSQANRKIKSCIGNTPEREAAFGAIRSNVLRGCVVDSVSFHILRRLQLEQIIEETCGPIAVTDATVSELEQRIERLGADIDREDLTIFWRDGEFFRSTNTSSEKKAALTTLSGDLSWIREHNAILPALEGADLPAELRRIDRLLGDRFADDMRAAQSANRILISEDLAYRKLASQFLRVQTTWLQPILMVARDNGQLPVEKYATAVEALISAGLWFVSIDALVLREALRRDTGKVAGRHFMAVAQALGGRQADMRSHISVAVNFLIEIWNSNAPWLLIWSATGALLDCLTRGGTFGAFEIVKLTWSLVRSRVQETSAFDEYIFGWLRGHFIVAPNSA